VRPPGTSITDATAESAAKFPPLTLQYAPLEVPMMKRPAVLRAASIVACLLHPAIAPAQYVVENLGRGVMAIRASETSVYVGWRLLGTDHGIGRAGEAERRAAQGHDEPGR
jgi:hypothetical protein